MTSTAPEAIDRPTADWVTIPDLYRDPLPIYRRMRAEAPVHWVPAVNRYMVTDYAACHAIEQDAERFSADETDSLMKRSMGHSMLRKDDSEHKGDRDSYGSTLRPNTMDRPSPFGPGRTFTHRSSYSPTPGSSWCCPCR